MAFVLTDLDSLICAFEADSIAGLSDGDDVTAWSDASVNGVDLAAASGEEPTYVASAVNSLPAVHFDGTASRMYSSVTAPTNGVANMGCAVIASLDTKKNYNMFFAFDTVGPASSYQRRSLWGHSGNDIYQYSSGGYTRTVSDFTTAYKMGAWIDGQHGHCGNVDGRSTALIFGSPTGTHGADWRITLGNASGLSSSFLDGKIAALIIWDETILGERAHIEGYLADKYAITLPTDHPFYSGPPTSNPGAAGGGLLRVAMNGGMNG
jgi:hypothetical protein